MRFPFPRLKRLRLLIIQYRHYSSGSLQTFINRKILATTRDFLLPKLMSGEIRAKDAENVAEAAS